MLGAIFTNFAMNRTPPILANANEKKSSQTVTANTIPMQSTLVLPARTFRVKIMILQILAN